LALLNLSVSGPPKINEQAQLEREGLWRNNNRVEGRYKADGNTTNHMFARISLSIHMISFIGGT
jgi:hypothetical protein